MSLPTILTTTEQVDDFAAALEKHGVIAVDLEADSMHNYQEKVCLLQFSTPETTVLIDPLAGADLSSLRPVMSNPDVRKVFHAADYDIRSLSRDFDITIGGLFDTMISCQFLGEERFGLADVLRKYFSVKLDKQYQRADWSKRPLSPEMVRYAAGDTLYLHDLAEILEAKLIEKGRIEWVEEEFRLMEQVRFADSSGPLFLRFKGAGTLKPRQLAVLEKLLQWRDKEAQRRDCPLYKVFGNKELLEISRNLPATAAALSRVPGVSPRLIERYGKKLLAPIQHALDVPESELPVYPRGERRPKDPQIEKRMIRLKEWRKKAAAELELDSGILINNALLEELARKHPQAEADFDVIDLLKNWQRKVLGAGILQALN